MPGGGSGHTCVCSTGASSSPAAARKGSRGDGKDAAAWIAMSSVTTGDGMQLYRHLNGGNDACLFDHCPPNNCALLSMTI